MERLLVTGVDTLLGSNLALALADRCEILGLFGSLAVQGDGVQTSAWNPEQPESLERQFDAWHPQWIIHCGPLAASSWEATPDEWAMRREASVVAKLTELSERWSASLLVLSSDAVFTGPRMFHDEQWPASNMTVRSTCTRAMESVAADGNALVIRTHAYGWGVDDRQPGFAEQAFRLLTAGRFPAANGRRYATPILATDLTEPLWRAYETRLRGLYHLAGAERTSTHRFLSEMAASLGGPFAAPLNEVDGDTQCHEETSLSSKRARRMLAVATPMLRDGLERFVAQSTSGWRDAWRHIESAHPLPEAAAA